jgi:hypothetical protein
MKRIFLLLMMGLVFYSCNTNPPTSPESISYPTGKILVTANLNFTQSATSTNKIVLLEDFANVSCVPCVTSNQIIESFLGGTYKGKIAVVKFPIYWPSPADPFYLANKTICDDRINFYNVTNAPTIMVDGILRQTTGTDSVTLKEKIDQRLTETAPFNILVTASYHDSSYFVNLDVQAANLNGVSLSDLVINTIITESDIEFDEAPGSNGEKIFYNVLRKILPGDNGIPVAGLVNLSQPITLNWDADLFSNWNPDNLHVVVFIQNLQTKEILQAGADY